MRLSVGLLGVAVAGMLGGAYLIALWVVGLVLVVLCAVLGGCVLLLTDWGHDRAGEDLSGVPEPIQRWMKAS